MVPERFVDVYARARRDYAVIFYHKKLIQNSMWKLVTIMAKAKFHPAKQRKKFIDSYEKKPELGLSPQRMLSPMRHCFCRAFFFSLFDCALNA
jgi:hypothetical protein